MNPIWENEQIPTIIYDILRLQEDTPEDVIKYESILEILSTESPYNTNQICNFITNNKGQTEKCQYSEQELLFLLNNIYHIPYLQNKKLINSPIIEVW
ncbi:hypothetical protein [Metabacillus fastidiosus]|uniref:hypothetical protein n=1 Tax=Metabacillus fastidiosus TaxID=1458 RepID=UPI002DB784DD|nr:hypothetical protein [Metabacillus fastidiosus]MEC2076113.1 hypothetical protein [Metabacillus fastidiosus]